VSITYAPHPSPPVYTIDGAIAAASFFDGSTTGGITTDHELEAGPDVEAVFKEEGVVREGSFGMGAVRVYEEGTGEERRAALEESVAEPISCSPSSL
jgi:hypothetical protein